MQSITQHLNTDEADNMKQLKKYLPILLIPLLISAVAHKFYVSVTHIEYAEEKKAIQITTRIFIDDLEQVLNNRYDIRAAMATEEEEPALDSYIGKYLNGKLRIRIDEEDRAYTFLGKEYKDDLVVCYLEIEGIDLEKLNTLEVTNDVLTEIFEEQQNVVHLRIGGKKKSFILVRGNNKGMLNLR